MVENFRDSQEEKQFRQFRWLISRGSMPTLWDH